MLNTIKDLIDDAGNKIGYIEANMIIGYVLNMDRAHLIINSDKVLDNIQINEIEELISKIEDGYPIQYITHKQAFMGLEFYVDESVLIPQPDTEILVEETIKMVKKKIENTYVKKDASNECGENVTDKIKFRILDLCTGSGAIAISIANYIINKMYNKDFRKHVSFEKKINQSKNNIEFEIIASDVSKEALEVAKKNYENIISQYCEENQSFKNDYELKDKQKCNIIINFIESDMFENIDGKFDIIVSNPPYIKSEEITKLSKDVRCEPQLALDGGKDGIKFYKVIKENIDKYLKEDGTILMEIGYDQKEDLLGLFEGARCIKDYAENDRVICIENV